MNKLIAIYARYSTDKQNDLSIEDQERRCRERIARDGHDPTAPKLYCDRAISGRSLDRPGLDALRQLVAKGLVGTIYAEDLARLSRDGEDTHAITKRFAYQRVRLVTVADGIDTAVPGHKLVIAMRGLMNEQYLDALSDYTKRGLRARAERGAPTGAAPFGYVNKENSVAINEEQAPTVVRIFELYAGGSSYGRIAAELNATHIPPPRGRNRTTAGERPNAWVGSAIRELLRNTKYVGEWRYNDTEWRKVPGTNRRKPFKRPADEVIVRQVPELRIVPDDLWRAVQGRLADVAIKYKATGERSLAARAVYPLSGILRCGTCGGRMNLFGSRHYYCDDRKKRGTCSNARSVRKDVAEKVILGALRQRLGRPECLEYVRAQLAKRLGEQVRGADKEKREREARLGRLEGKRSRLVMAVAEGVLQARDVAQELRDIEAAMDLERRALAELECVTIQPVKLPSLEQLERAVFDIEARLRQEPILGRTRLHQLFEDGRITVETGPDGTQVAKAALLPLMVLAENSNGGPGEDRRYLSGVAGAGFEPATFGL